MIQLHDAYITWILSLIRPFLMTLGYSWRQRKHVHEAGVPLIYIVCLTYFALLTLSLSISSCRLCCWSLIPRIKSPSSNRCIHFKFIIDSSSILIHFFFLKKTIFFHRSLWYFSEDHQLIFAVPLQIRVLLSAHPKVLIFLTPKYTPPPNPYKVLLLISLEYAL